jgi:hypothetical protein
MFLPIPFGMRGLKSRYRTPCFHAAGRCSTVASILKLPFPASYKTESGIPVLA